MNGDRLVFDGFGDPLLDVALSRAPEAELGRLADVSPLPKQRALVERALDLARGELRLPPRFHVRYVAAPRGAGIQHAETTRHEDGRIEIVLDITRSPFDLVRCCFHEAQHVADFLAGWYPPKISRVRSEERAIAFEQAMMARYADHLLFAAGLETR